MPADKKEKNPFPTHCQSRLLFTRRGRLSRWIIDANVKGPRQFYWFFCLLVSINVCRAIRLFFIHTPSTLLSNFRVLFSISFSLSIISYELVNVECEWAKWGSSNTNKYLFTEYLHLLNNQVELTWWILWTGLLRS